MRAHSLINFGVLVLVGASAYFLTLFMDQNKPSIIVQPEAPIETIKTGQAAPDFSFTDTNGKNHSLKEFEGKIIILNFWASWCPPCLKEFPHFLTAAKEFENDVVFIGVSSDLDAQSMNKFLNKLGRDIKKPNVFITLDSDQNITKTLFQTYRLPETILIGRNQIMRTKIVGADWDYKNLQTIIKTLKKS